jgi:hypothetical protein
LRQAFIFYPCPSPIIFRKILIGFHLVVVGMHQLVSFPLPFSSAATRMKKGIKLPPQRLWLAFPSRERPVSITFSLVQESLQHTIALVDPIKPNILVRMVDRSVIHSKTIIWDRGDTYLLVGGVAVFGPLLSTSYRTHTNLFSTARTAVYRKSRLMIQVLERHWQGPGHSRHAPWPVVMLGGTSQCRSLLSSLFRTYRYDDVSCFQKPWMTDTALSQRQSRSWR